MIVLDPVNGAGAGGMVTDAQGRHPGHRLRPVHRGRRLLHVLRQRDGRQDAGRGAGRGDGRRGRHPDAQRRPDRPQRRPVQGRRAQRPRRAATSRSSRSSTTPTGARRTPSSSSPTSSSNYDPSEIQGVYAANDGQAGGVVAALTGAGVAADALPPITGQDAELAAIQRILAGEQAMTIYKPIPIEAETAAEVAVELANGEDR